MAELSRPEQIGPIFAGFQNDPYVPQKKLPDPLINRRISGLIRMLIRRDHPAVDQG
jgi:hypothetical protein